MEDCVQVVQELKPIILGPKYAKGARRMRRVELIEIAEDLIKKKGLRGFAVREVARAAGMSSGAPYRHFGSKEELFLGIAIRGFNRLCVILRDSLDSSTIEADYLGFAKENPEIYQVMFGCDSSNPGLRTAAKALVDLLMEKFIGSSAARSFAKGYWAKLHGLAVMARLKLEDV